MRICLVAAVLAGTIFGSFGQFLQPQKVKAIAPPPVTVSNPFYTDTTKNQIRFNISVPPRPTSDLITATKDPSITDATKYYDFGGGVTFSDISPSMPTNIVAYKLDQFTLPSGGRGYIIVKDDQIIKSGYYLDRLPIGTLGLGNGAGVVIIKNVGDTAHVSLMANGNNTVDYYNDKNWATLTFLAGGRAGVIAVLLSATNMEAACKSVNTDWEALKEDIRSLSIPKPGSVSGASANPNWDVTTSVTFAGLVAGLREGAGAIATWVENTAASAVGLNADAQATAVAIRQQTLVPTTAGENRLRDVFQRAGLMDDNLANLIANNANCGSYGVKFRKFKWNKTAESDTDIYTSLTDLKTDIAALVAVARQYFDFFQEPVTTAGELGEEGACGKMGYSFGRKMWYVLLCNMGDLLHLIAGSLMTKATEYLQASIGIDSVKFESPAKVSEESGNSPTGGTPASSNPSGGSPSAPATPGTTNVTSSPQ
jgi:hypothetical protein